MSRQTPPPAAGPLPGQITQPNPIEIFWEKNRKSILLGVGAILLVFAGIRVWRYLERQKRNDIWGSFATAAGWRSGYEPTDLSWFELLKAEGMYQPYKVFGEAVAESDQLDRVVGNLASKAAAAQAYWLVASKHAMAGDVDGVKQALAEIEKLDKGFPGLLERPWPPIYVPIPEEDEPKAESPKRPKKVEPAEPKAAALKDVLLQIATSTTTFRAEHKALFEAPEPDAKPEIVFETTAGTFKVRVYGQRAPKHSAQFVENCRSGFYDGLRFHELRRQATDANNRYGYEGDLAFLGDPASKEEDRSKWGTFKSEEQTPWEDSGVSHFPFVVAAERQSDKKGSDQKLVYFTAGDAEKRDDGYVVFARVVEGQDVVRKITNAKLASTADEAVGRGKPADPVVVTKVQVVE